MNRVMALVAMLSISAPAFAEETGSSETAEVEQTPHRLNLNVSVLHALAPPHLVSVGPDIRLGEKASVVAIVGVGPGKTDRRDANGDYHTDDVICVQAIVMGHYVLWGDFDRGLFGGGGLAYLYMSREDESIRRNYEGLWAGPQVGYKYTFGFDLVVTADLAAGINLYRPDGLDEDDVPGIEERTDGPPIFGPVIVAPNLTVGWAF